MKWKDDSVSYDYDQNKDMKILNWNPSQKLFLNTFNW